MLSKNNKGVTDSMEQLTRVKVTLTFQTCMFFILDTQCHKQIPKILLLLLPLGFSRNFIFKKVILVATLFFKLGTG